MIESTPASARRDSIAVVNEYFERMRARDPSMVELFHDNACLVGLGKVMQGKTEILEFYRHIIETAGPTPQIIGEPLTAGPRIAVEILIELASGGTVHAIDLFEIEDGRIRSLSYFLATH